MGRHPHLGVVVWQRVVELFALDGDGGRAGYMSVRSVGSGIRICQGG